MYILCFMVLFTCYTCYIRWCYYLLEVGGDFLGVPPLVDVVYLHHWDLVVLLRPDRSHGLHVCQCDGKAPHLAQGYALTQSAHI